jgi:hypothetical protein
MWFGRQPSQYICSERGLLLKEREKHIDNNIIMSSSSSEECSKCGSLLSKTLKRIKLKSAVEEQQQSNIIIRAHGLSSLSSSLIFVDTGEGNSSNIYQCVIFVRQYGLRIKKLLQSIVVSAAFTIHQISNIIIYHLHNVIQQFNAKDDPFPTEALPMTLILSQQKLNDLLIDQLGSSSYKDNRKQQKKIYNDQLW